MPGVEIVERRPTLVEYETLTAAVGWKARDPEAVREGLKRSLYSVCAIAGDETVGMGRIIGDGGLHYYLTDIVVNPKYQRRGVGSAIVAALTRYVESVPFKNTWVGVFAVEGTAEFYARHGYKSQSADGPAMFRWLNRQNV